LQAAEWASSVDSSKRSGWIKRRSVQPKIEKAMNVGGRIRAFREAKGFSQGDIERRSGLLRSYISRVEGGYTAPSIATLEKFAKALELETYQLLFSRNGNGRPHVVSLPSRPGVSRSASRLLKAYEGMSAGNRKLVVSLMSQLAKLSG
jgi:transcriptional regulator with XRE-family HTH domain